MCRGKIGGAKTGKTKLDKERVELCDNEVRSIGEDAAKLLKTLREDQNDDNNKEYFKLLKEFLEIVETIKAEPQHSLPDIIIWMICGQKRTAYARIPAQHVIFSQVEAEKGKYCGKEQTIFLRLPGKKGEGSKGWMMHGQMTLSVWLGLHKHKKNFLDDIPKGFDVPKGAKKMMAPCPSDLVYTSQQKFILRAHLYQARGLVGSDASGLSDAFARVIFGHKSADTRVIWETRSPTWDEMIMLDDIGFWKNIEEVVDNPPMIVVDIFDKDIGGDIEFIGRALVRPVVKTAEERYKKPRFPPILEWFQIRIGLDNAGELLAAFELLQVADDGICTIPEPPKPVKDKKGNEWLPVPDDIRPVMAKHKIEVLFWGVREMKRVGISAVERPLVIIECAGHQKESVIIQSAKINPNFEKQVTSLEMMLPEKDRYCPPLTFRVEDVRSFNRRALCGTHIVNSLLKFLQDMKEFEGEETADAQEEGEEQPPSDEAPVSAEGEKAIAQDTFETQQEGEAGENEEREQVTDGNQNEEMNGIDEIDMDGIVTTEKCEGIGGVNEGYEGDQENIEMSPTGSRVLLPEVVIVSSPAPSEKTAKLLTPTGSPLVSAKGSLRTSQHNTPVREASDVDASSKRRASVNSQAGSIISRISSRIRTPRGSKLGTPARSVSKLGTPIRSGSNLATPINSGSYVETPRKSSLGSPLRSSSQLGTPVRSSSQLGTPIRSGSKLGTPLRSSSQLGTPIRSESRLEALEGDAEAGDVQEVGLDVVQEEDSKQEGDITKETVGEERQGDATAAADETKPEAEAADQKQEPVPEEEGNEEDENKPSEKISIIDIGKEDIKGSDDEEEEEEEEKEEEEEGKEEEEDEEALDWWSRFYETVKDLEREEEEKRQREKKKNKQGKKKGKKAKIEVEEEEEPVKKRKLPNPKITRLKIYKTELENVPEFTGFNDWLYSFPLLRGKSTSADGDDEEKRTTGKFKGAIKLWRYPLPASVKFTEEHGSFTRLPSNEPIGVLTRIYVIRALDLHPTDLNGKADPYLVVHCGKMKNKDRDNYIPKQLNPIFGRFATYQSGTSVNRSLTNLLKSTVLLFEFEAQLPMDNMVKIQVFDYDLVGSDDLIGETKIDIENRFYSKHRPTCGVGVAYSTHGFNKWRDVLKPSHILSKLCKDEKLDGPHYPENGKCRIENYLFHALPHIIDEQGNTKESDEPAAIKALHNFHLIKKKGYHLVPEHVETRSLWHPDKPGIEQGKIEIWIDLFAMDMPPPGAPVDVTPRKPRSMELRVIIWNVEEIPLEDVNVITGVACADIYVKGWIEGMKDHTQKTDIHYSSLTGEGNFNWRFIFPFQFMKAEEKVVVRKKASFFSLDESEEKLPPRLTLQVWDSDAFSSDDFIGDVCLALNNMPRGAKASKTCSLDTMKPEKAVSIFKMKHLKAWWPFSINTEQDEPKVVGKCEAEIELLTQEEALKEPAGKGREEPQPLDKPNRPDTSMTWFLNPFTVLRYMLWEKYKGCLLKFAIMTILLGVMGLFLYSMPGYVVKKVFGA